jgi:hypothetical protein
MLPTPPRHDQAIKVRRPQDERVFVKNLDYDEEMDDDDFGRDMDNGGDEPDEGDDDDLVTIATFRTAPEAELVKTALDAEGIQAFIADAETVTMDWLLGLAIGDVKVQVARRVAAQAREFLAQRRQVHEDDETPGPTTCLACQAPFPEDATRCPACGWSFEDEGK